MTKLYLGIDGGGTHCRSRLVDEYNNLLGEAIGGSANTTLGVESAFNVILDTVHSIFNTANIPHSKVHDIHAGLGLAGLVDAIEISKIETYPHPFKTLTASSDAVTACYGAHDGKDGGIAIFGTGSIGCALHNNKMLICGGWGFVLGDQGSGAQLGLQTLRQTMLACDKLIAHTPLTKEILEHFNNTPSNLVRWVIDARPKDFGEFAKTTCKHAELGEKDAVELLKNGAKSAELLIRCLTKQGVERISLLGGLAPHLHPYLPQDIKDILISPKGDAMSGAIFLAKNQANAQEVAL